MFVCMGACCCGRARGGVGGGGGAHSPYTHTYKHTNTHAYTHMYAHARARPHARTHTRARARTHARTHTKTQRPPPPPPIRSQVGHAGPAETPYLSERLHLGSVVTVEVDRVRRTLSFIIDGVNHGALALAAARLSVSLAKCSCCRYSTIPPQLLPRRLTTTANLHTRYE